MKKPFWIILSGLLLFFAAPSFSQDTLVQIKPEVARFFLEKNEENKVHIVKDSLQDILISTLRGKILTQEQIITTYQSDSVTYTTLINNKQRELTLTKRELRKQRVLKYVGYVIAVGVIVLAL